MCIDFQHCLHVFAACMMFMYSLHVFSACKYQHLCIVYDNRSTDVPWIVSILGSIHAHTHHPVHRTLYTLMFSFMTNWYKYTFACALSTLLACIQCMHDVHVFTPCFQCMQVPTYMCIICNKIVIHGTPQMAVDKEAIFCCNKLIESLLYDSKCTRRYSMCNPP